MKINPLNPSSPSNVLPRIEQQLAYSNQKIVKPVRRLQVSQNFNRRLRILIPTTVDINIPADTSEFVERANLLFSQLFGGTICKRFLGFYESQESGLIQEMVFEIEAWTNDINLKKAEAALEDFMIDLLVELGQETVFFAVDNEARLLKLAAI